MPLRGHPADLPGLLAAVHGRVRPLRAEPPGSRWPEGPVCNTCYTAALRRRGTCTGCGQQRRLVFPPGPGAGICADCAGLIITHACALCGIEDKLFEKGRCARCSLRQRTAALIRDPTGPAMPGPAIALDRVAGAITAARTPYSALNWLRTGAAAAILADVAAGRTALTHKALDDHPHQRAADYLRHMLVAGGVLPPATRPWPAWNGGARTSSPASITPPTGASRRPT